MALSDRLAPKNVSPRGGILGLKYAGARAKVLQGSSSSFTEKMHFTKIYFFCALTPELSRADLRPWASENEQSSHEAAKRARLERIVRCAPSHPGTKRRNVLCHGPAKQVRSAHLAA